VPDVAVTAAANTVPGAADSGVTSTLTRWYAPGPRTGVRHPAVVTSPVMSVSVAWSRYRTAKRPVPAGPVTSRPPATLPSFCRRTWYVAAAPDCTDCAWLWPVPVALKMPSPR